MTIKIFTSNSKSVIARYTFLLLATLLLSLKLDAQTTTFYINPCDDASGWTLGAMPPYTSGHGEYTAWRIGNSGTYAIDGNSLQINAWNNITGSNKWTNEYLKNQLSIGIIAKTPVDARKYKSMELQFDWICKGEYSTTGANAYDYGQVGYSLDGGATFTWLSTGGLTNNGKYFGTTTVKRGQRVTLPSSLNNQQFTLGFRWINDGSNGANPGFIVDNIKVSGEAAAVVINTPVKQAALVDACDDKLGWVFESGPSINGSFTSWRIGSEGSCNIDTSSLTVSYWNRNNSKDWSCGYVSKAVDIKAYKKVDGRNYENLELQFDWTCAGEYSGAVAYDYGQVGYSIDGGATFKWISAGGVNNTGKYYGSTSVMRAQKLALPASLNDKEFYIGFRWINNESIEKAPGFVIDNIQLNGAKKTFQLTEVLKDNFDSKTNWQLKNAPADPAGNILGWNIDNSCGSDGNALSIKLYNATSKDWVCGFATAAAADLVACRSMNTGTATNLFLKMDWKATAPSANDYGQVGYSLDDGQTFTWLTQGGTSAGKYYNQPTLVKSALVPLPAVLQDKNFLLGFHWVNDGVTNTGQPLLIDNLSIVGVVNSTAAAAEKDHVIMNRINEEVVQLAGKKTEADVDALNEFGKIVTKTYYDGSDRDVQIVSVKASPAKTDIVAPILYDGNGKSGTSFLPYKAQTTDGGYHAMMLAEQYIYYNTDRPNFSKTEFARIETVSENSPEQRVIEIGSIGKEFQTSVPASTVKRTVTQKFLTAIDNNPPSAWEAIKSIRLYDNSTDLLAVDYYSAANGFSNLFVTETTDEDKNIKRNYVDTKGKLILERNYASNSTTILTQTYYVYDDFDRLRLIIQPEGMAKITDVQISLDASFMDYCFEFRYDESGRVNATKTPGGGWKEIAYDRWDRPVITQDANQRVKSPQEFTFVKYDLLNRPIITGTFTALNRSLTMDVVKAELNTTALGARFENRSKGTLPNMDYSTTLAYPMANGTNSLEILTQLYYDDYKYSDVSGFNFANTLGYTSGSTTKSARGMATGLKTKILGSNTYLITVNFYDQYDRLIQVQKQNGIGVKSSVTTTYDFTGRPLATEEDNKLTAAVGVVLKTTNQYDHMGRVTRVLHQTNSQPEVVLADYKYTDLGNLIKEKNLHSTNNGNSYLQSVDYTFNEKGLLTHINNSDLSNDGIFNDDSNDLFGLDLVYYKDQQMDNTKAQYNGNLSEQIWKNKYDNKKKGYLYTYDGLNRLTAAAYKVKSTDWNSNAENGRYTLAAVTYDGNGNIQTMQQNGLTSATTYGAIDNLTYSYEANRLVNVSDAIPTTTYPYDFENSFFSGKNYTYDDNGNLIADPNKNIIAINYNLLNLPKEIYYTNRKSIIFTYDASGMKLKTEMYNGADLTGTIDYWGSAQYINNVFQFAATGEGRVFKDAGTYKYDYFIKDQVGSVRLSFYAASDGTVQIGQVNDYYPHGNSFFSYSSSTTPKNNYTFNGMEFQEDNGLNTFDFHARMYDPQLGRSFQPDPLAYRYGSSSPYAFLDNNPICKTDPTGMAWRGYVTFKLKAMDGGGGGGGNGGYASYGGYGDYGGYGEYGGGFGGNVHQGNGNSSGLKYDWITGCYKNNGEYLTQEEAMGLIQNKLSPVVAYYWRAGKSNNKPNFTGGTDLATVETVQEKVYYNTVSGNGDNTGGKSSGWGLSFYSGVPIISSPWVNGAGFTPGPFVVTPPGVKPNTSPADRDFIRHEIGHVATFIATGTSFPLYLSIIALPSAINFHFPDQFGGSHDAFYTEKIANTLSEWIYGPFIGPYKNTYPSYNTPKK